MPLNTTAVIMSFEEGLFVRECLENSLNQSCPFHEILLVDASRSGKTFQIWQEHYRDRVRYTALEFSEPFEVAIEASRQATGDALIFLNPRDRMHPEFHEVLHSMLCQDNSLALAVPRGDSRQAHPFDAENAGLQEPFDAYDLLWENRIGDSALIRKSAWDAVTEAGQWITGMKDLSRALWQMWLSMIEKGWGFRISVETLYEKDAHGKPRHKPLSEEEIRVRQAWQLRIQEKHLRYDLTIISLMEDRQKVLDEFLSSLEQLHKPPSTQIIFVDGNPGPARTRKLLRYCTHYMSQRLKGERRTEWIFSAIRSARKYVRGREILFLGEDIVLRPESWWKLHAGKEQKRAQFYSGRSISTRLRRVMAWRATSGDPDQGIYHVPVIRRSKRVFATGFDCLLTDFETMQGFEVMKKDGRKLFENPIMRVALNAWHEGKRWFVDGRVLGTRLIAPGKKVRLNALSSRGRESGAPEKPDVTIIIPVRNGEKHLGALLESIENMDYQLDQLEVIVVDNQSRDKTVRTASSFPWVKVLSEPRISSYAARNRGIRNAHAGFIAFLDADCVVTPQWLNEMIAEIAPDPEVGIVGGTNLPSNGQQKLSQAEREHGGYANFQGGLTPEGRLRPPYVIMMNTVFRRQVFEELGLFDASQISGSDVDMSWRIQQNSHWKVKILSDKGLVFHRDIADGLSYLRRQKRIGHGRYGLYQKYPQLMDQTFYWLPDKGWEIFLRFCMQNVPFSLSSPKDAGERRRMRFRQRRDFFQQCGYQRHALAERREMARNVTAQPSACVFAGKTSLIPTLPVYNELREIADRGVPVLHLDPAIRGIRSWYQFAISLLGGTSRWHWHPQLISMEPWTLFPSRWKWGREWNGRVNRIRIRRALSTDQSSVHVIRSAADAQSRLEGLRQLSPHVIPFRRGSGVSMREILHAGIVCLLDEVGEDVDLAAYAAIAESTGVPVVVAGKMNAEVRRRAAAYADRVPAFSFMATHELRKVWHGLVSRSNIALYLYQKESWKKNALPPFWTRLIEKEMTFITTPCREFDETGRGVVVVRDEAEAVRTIRISHRYPKNPLQSVTKDREKQLKRGPRRRGDSRNIRMSS